MAILHPKKLSVYKVTINEEDEINTHSSLDLMYERELPRHCYSLHAGPFWLCVQSLTEGLLYFFENEREGISCRLPCASPIFFPSPICYIRSIESLVVCSSSTLHSYRQFIINVCINVFIKSLICNFLYNEFVLVINLWPIPQYNNQSREQTVCQAVKCCPNGK